MKALFRPVSSLVTAAALAFAAPVFAEDAPAAQDRVVSIGGAVTEIIYALGEQDRVVARDTTSSHPPEVMELPDVGYMRALSPEGVLSVNPDLIVAVEGAGPSTTIDVLREAQIEFVIVPEAYSREGVSAKIQAVGEAMGKPDAATALAAQVDADIAAAMQRAEATDAGSRKRVMFVLSTMGGRVMASGTGTAADAIIQMSGGVNAITGFEGYKPLTDEAITLAAPDVILMMDRGGNHSTNDDDLFTMPAIATTPAAENRAVLRVNGLLMLGFGPRTAEAISLLSNALDGAS